MPSPETRLIRQQFPEFYTSSELGAEIGKSKSTIERWRKSGTLVPSRRTNFGSKTVWLYTDEDLDRARQVAKTIKPGRTKSMSGQKEKHDAA